ncbi:DUF4255 domain-containing protein [Sinomicrobium pectinilyticum]|uniref:DUF4255 domain-containing protein n=1 Tax=Sinomicrobium pectinilyticum TaxID=1084421 RepID=A0A3N0EUW8_SINP1|nr:DUF4255 domain-containing protein [Sinomicrobium pectinilyticum]RNL91715.1 DUF4255 domain-containing protein [Sinomicrobium pectinilyticum]
MLFEIAQIITEQVNQYLEDSGLDRSVILENIAILDSQNENADELTDKVALTLISFHEETTLKNIPNNTFEPDRVLRKNPVIHLNLFMLFSANRNTYNKSLKDISKVIEFFQGKKVFTQTNTVYDRDSISMTDITNFKFTIELYTPTFEELNFIWGTLGGRQLPSALYKLSIVQIERKDIITGEKGLITEINGTLNKN